MVFRKGASLIVVAAGALALFPSVSYTLKAEADPHAYFRTLITRSDHWLSYSLRDSRQLAHPNDGGFAHANSRPLLVTYAPTTDTDPNRQDAAKVVIPPFATNTTLASPLSVADTAVTPEEWSSTFVAGQQVKIGHEIMVITSQDPRAAAPRRFYVTRGRYQTEAVPHAVGASVQTGSNSLVNQIRLPLGTSDGNTYIFVWDAYWTDSYLKTGLTNHKAFQFADGGQNIWLEPQTRFDGGGSEGKCEGWNPDIHVAGIEARSYNRLGGNVDWTLTDGNFLGPMVTGNLPIAPKTGSFCLAANKWTRFWVRIQQRANDYDYVDMWVADETRSAVQVYRNIPASLRSNTTPANTISKFWLEFNTSTEGLPEGRTDDFAPLTAYVRNFVALRTQVDPATLLQQPLGGLPIAAPARPTNLRVVK